MTKKSLLLLGLLVITLLSLVGCAAIIHGSRQNIDFTTTPSGATVEVLDAMDLSHGICETPCTMRLKRNKEYKVLINKAGYNGTEMVLQKSTSGWIWGNILLGGIIGLIVDFSGGAAYKLTPELLQVTLSETTSSLPDIGTGDGIVFIDFDDLTEKEKEKVITLESFDWPIANLTK